MRFFLLGRLYFKEIDIEIRYQRKILTMDLFMRWCVIYL